MDAGKIRPLTQRNIKVRAVTILDAVAQSGQPLAGGLVVAGRTSPAQSGAPPLILVYIHQAKSQMLGDGDAEPKFKLVWTLTIDVRIEGKDQYVVDGVLDDAIEAIKTAILGDIGFVASFEKITRVDSGSKVEEDGKQWVGDARVEIDLQATDVYQPVITQPLLSFNLYGDSRSVFDPLGTYTPPFDYQTTTAPRTSGPDGRVEIGAIVNLPQPD